MDSQTDLSPRPIGRPPSCTCGTCRRCRKAAYMRDWYQRKTVEERRAWVARRDPERVADTDRQRQPDKYASTRRSHLRYPERERARYAVHNAINRGKLLRQPCWCGIERSEAHHPDYSRPLDVEWLCRRHHADKHLS